MTCRECQPVLQEYLDGELDPKIAKGVAGHLAGCDGCTAELNQLRSELAIFQHYTPEIQVTPDLWAGIQARLEVQESLFTNTRNSPLPGWLARVVSAPRVSVPATVALVLVAIIATVFIMNRIPQSEEEDLGSVKNVENPIPTEAKTGEPQPLAKKPEQSFSGPEGSKLRKAGNTLRRSGVSRSSESQTPEQLVREAEKKYLAAIGILSRDIERNQSQLDPDMRTKFEQALASIDRTIGATRKAVRQHPDDPVAVQYMLAAYAKKVDVLREMAGGGTF